MTMGCTQGGCLWYIKDCVGIASYHFKCVCGGRGVPGPACRLVGSVAKHAISQIGKSQLKERWGEVCLSALGRSLLCLTLFLGSCVLLF